MHPDSCLMLPMLVVQRLPKHSLCWSLYGSSTMDCVCMRTHVLGIRVLVCLQRLSTNQILRRACEKLPKLSAPLQPPVKLPVADAALTERCGGVPLEALGLARMPVSRDGAAVDWGSPLMAAWRCSEAAAIQALDEFLDIGESSHTLSDLDESALP